MNLSINGTLLEWEQ